MQTLRSTNTDPFLPNQHFQQKQIMMLQSFEFKTNKQTKLKSEIMNFLLARTSMFIEI